MSIDNGQSQIIVDNAEVPEGTGCAASTVKAVLWALRSLGGPGALLNYSRDIIVKRTQLSARAVGKAISVLIEHGVLVQESRSAPGRFAQYRIDYERLMDWVPEHDLERARLVNGRTRCQRSQAPDASVRAHQMPASEATVAPGARTVAPGARTVAPGAGVIKEETALPAKPPAPAAARPESAKTQTGVEAEQQLANLSAGGGAGGVGVMDREAWERLGKVAKLKPEDRMACAGVLVTRDIQDAEAGLAAMEKLADRLKAPGTLKSPIGLFTSFLDPEADRTGPCNATTIRHRNLEQQRRQLGMNIELNWSDERKHAVFVGVRTMLTRRLGEAATAEILSAWYASDGVRDWDAMLDFIWVNMTTIESAQQPAPQLTEVYA